MTPVSHAAAQRHTGRTGKPIWKGNLVGLDAKGEVIPDTPAEVAKRREGIARAAYLKGRRRR